MRNAKYLSIFLLIFIGGFILMTILASCSVQKRHDRLVARYPSVCVKDTYYIKDTIVKTVKVPVPEYRDSFIVTHDTIIETKKISFKKKGNKFSIDVKPDTITYTDTIPYEVRVPGKVITKENFNWIYLFISFLLGIIAALFISNELK